MHLWAKSHDRLQLTIKTLYEQYLIQQGQKVEALAKKYVESFLLPNYESAQLFWQPSYNDNQFEIRADALIWDKYAEVYDLYEIKSSTSIHREHEYDITFQVLLLEEILDLRQVSIIHIDKNYQHAGDLNLENFFTVEDVAEYVEKRRADTADLRQEALAVSQMTEPDPAFACTKPNTCPCPEFCHPELPNNPIYDIPYIGRKAVQLREMGITDIRAVPPTFNLNEKQQKHVQSVKTGQPLIESQAIHESLSSLAYPLFFLDYETFNPAIPLFAGYRPYEHIVFQYSLHVIETPGADAEHFDRLIADGSDPAPIIVPHLLNNLGEKGSVIVWNQSFEAYRNLDLGSHCPSFRAQLENINNRLFDLMVIFKDGLYVHPDFHGSASLKAVLPALCPELSYENLNISNGEEAMMTWYWLQTSTLDQKELEPILDSMREYCKLDTYAMVAILEKLKQINQEIL